LRISYKFCDKSELWGVYTIQQTSSKLPANVFKIHVLMLDVCWTFAGSCKHPIKFTIQNASTALECLRQWFSTGVPRNPRVPRPSAKGSAAGQ